MSMDNGVLNINLERYGLDDIKKHDLDHPVNEAFLTAVWSRIRKWFWLNIALYAIFLVLLTWSVWLNYSSNNSGTPPTSSSNLSEPKAITNLSEPNSTINLPKPNSTIFGEFWKQGLLVTFVALFWLLLVVREIVQMCLQKSKIFHYLTLDNVIDWILIGVTSAYIVNFLQFLIWGDPNDQNLASSCGSFAVLVGWLNIPFYLSELPLVGTIIHFAFDVLITIIQVGMVIATPCIMAFGLFFHFEITNTGSANWWYHDILKAFSMMLGNPDTEEYVTDKHSTFPLALLNEFAIGVFMIVMCLVIQNVLLTLTVGRLEFFSKNADFIRMERLLRAFKSFSDLRILKLPNEKWKNLRVSKTKNDEIRTWQAYIFKSMIKAQGHHYHTSIEYRAQLYDQLNQPKPYDVAIPSWVINKAEEILNKVEDVVDNRNLNTSLIDLASQKTQVAQMHTILVNQETQITQLRTDNQNLTSAFTNLNTSLIDLAAPKTQVAQMHAILVNQETQITQLRTDNQNLTNALTDQKTQIAEMHSILVNLTKVSSPEKKNRRKSYPKNHKFRVNFLSENRKAKPMKISRNGVNRD